MTSRRELGRWGEEEGCRYLQEKGYQIVARNYRCPVGELDLVARQGEVLVFIEVRVKSGSGFGTAAESVDYFKQRRLKRVAGYYLAGLAVKPANWRFDVVAIDLAATARPPRFEHYENAFG